MKRVVLNPPVIAFGGFFLDEESERLWYGEVECGLRHKTFAVLRELCRHRGRLVTKEHFFRTCWPATTVSPTVLRVCILEIRTALARADGSVRVEAVGRRGYRLVVASDGDDHNTRSWLFGREREWKLLQRALARSGQGLRQAVLVHGEPGIGKTTLLQHFVEDARCAGARVAFTQCVELTGSIEPYLPILEILGRLCDGGERAEALAVLERWAPSWLLQMPGLIDEELAQRLHRRVPSPNRDRMLRELADMFEALAADRTLVLVIDDMHWIDASSAEALAYVAQRVTPSCLLLIGSYRPADIRQRGGRIASVRDRLVAMRRATEIALQPFGMEDVEAYLEQRLHGGTVAEALARELRARTEGNPLFLSATIDHLLDRRILVATGGRWHCESPLDGAIPDGLRSLALQQLGQLAPNERSALDAACIVGMVFRVEAIVAAIGLPRADLEDTCAALAARSEIVQPVDIGDSPSGTSDPSYRFRHVLYREVLEEALPPSVRRNLHARVAESLRAGCRDGDGSVTATLAVHYAAAGDAENAIRQHEIAAAAAQARFANREAAAHLGAALGQLERLPASQQRSQRELALLLELGSVLAAARGVASREVRDVHHRALALADALDAPMARFQIHGALFAFDVMRADLTRASAAAEALLSTAEEIGIPFFSFVGNVMVGCVRFNLGNFAEARRHLEAAQSAWQPDFPQLAFDPGVLGRAMLGFAAALQAETARGDACIRDCIAWAESESTPYNLSYAYELAAQYFATVGDRASARAMADNSAALAREHGFLVHESVARLVRGWSEGDAAAIRAGIEDYQEAGQALAISFFRALLIETLLAQARTAEAGTELSAAYSFVERTGERRHMAELLRLEGELLRCTRPDLARSVLDRSYETAREQGARLWQWRTAMSLAELLISAGDRDAARAIVAEVEDITSTVGSVPESRRLDAIRATLGSSQG